MSLATIAVNVVVGDGRDVKHRDWLMRLLPERRFGKTELRIIYMMFAFCVKILLPNKKPEF